jgi:hypothetical protein
MYAEIQTFVTAQAEATKTFEEAHQALRDKYPNRDSYTASYEVRRAENDAFYIEFDKLNTDQRVTINEAWAKLQESNDPLVRWIGANCKDYQREATFVLEALPASMDDLESLAESHDFCGIWRRMVESARAAGVLPAGDPVSEAQRAVVTWVQEHGDIYRSDIPALRRLVKAVADEAVAQATGGPMTPTPADQA